MGDLVVHQFVSADGFAGDESGEFTLFDGSGPSDELDNETLSRLETVDAILLGATTYRMFATFWPTSDSDQEILAQRINELPKIVVSTTLEEAPWGEYPPAMVVSDDAAEAVRRFKRDLPGDLIVWGSLTLTDTLFAAGLVDAVRLAVLPKVLGHGRSAFPARSSDLDLRLVRVGSYDGRIATIDYQNERKGPS
ncbi:dihydrofolate reductase family protein [Conyzicola nivalis]|uniref:Pyrimidine reductase n=1 Tax=Conyzicola nivalis TaxID=1477021 RepID=A0A916SK38_9MICO|nr:dihydrofolate reductase family protein [Conyzicola nivalis]GGB00234.1 pyrimidine reductase [Conyzicola nivalis]